MENQIYAKRRHLNYSESSPDSRWRLFMSRRRYCLIPVWLKYDILRINLMKLNPAFFSLTDRRQREERGVYGAVDQEGNPRRYGRVY